MIFHTIFKKKGLSIFWKVYYTGYAECQGEGVCHIRPT